MTKPNMKVINNNGSDFTMHLNLSNHQLKVECYKHSLVYMEHMVVTNQKSTREVQEIRRKESKHNTTGRHQHKGEECKGNRKEQRGTSKIMIKQLIKWQ